MAGARLSIINMMPKETVQVKEIAPISSFEEFGVRLASMAPALDEETDPIAYFAPQISQMEKFALGPFQWCIVDFANQKLLEIGGMIEEFTGKPYAYWVGAPADEYVVELAKPEHIPHWMGYIQFVYEYILQNPFTNKDRMLHPHIYLEMRGKGGMFRNVVMQFIDWKVESNGGVRYCLCQVTDLSHLSAQIVAPQLVILEVKNGESLLIRSKSPQATPERLHGLPVFTPREKDVIKLLAAGHTSKLIASALGITKNTVENHRQRLLKKAGCYTSSELTAYAINHGLI